MADIVDAFEHHHPFHAGLAQHIAIEAGQRAGSGHVAQNPVAANPHVDHGDVGRRLLCRQPGRQQRGPTVIGVGGGEVPVRDGIAQGHDQPSGGGRRDVDALQPVIPLRGGRIRHGRLSGDIPFLDVGGMQADGMGGGQAGFAREVQTDRQILERGHCQIHRVAQNHHAGPDRTARFAVESERPVRPRNDFGLLGANGDMRRAHGQRLGSERIGEDHAQPAAADAGARDHAHGLIVEASGARGLGRRGWRGRRLRRRRPGQQLRRSPGGHPMLRTFLLSLETGEDQNQQHRQS